MSAGYGFPPSSQSPNNHLNIFVYPSGVPLAIFVEASSIRSRPKLIRSLRNSGAEICHDPAHAHIILVDANTDPGRQFIRDWGTDTTKIVLEYTWVNKSVEAGRALLYNDIWGGCIALDDGEPIKVVKDEIMATNPLPTPRSTPWPTPSDAEPSSKIRGRSESARSKPDRESRDDVQSHNFDKRSASRISESPHSQTFPQSHQVMHTQHVSQPPPFSPSQQAPQPQQYPQSQSYSQYPQQHSQLQQFTQSQQFSQPQQFSQSQPLVNNAGTQFTNPFAQGSAPQMQQFSQMQLGQGAPYAGPMSQNFMGQPNGSYDPQILLANLMDILRQQNLQMPVGMPQIQQTPNNITQQMFQPQNFQSNGLLPLGQEQSISSSLPNVSYDAVKGSSYAAASRSPSPQVCPPSICRRSVLASTPTPTPTPTPSPPPPTRSKGKMRAVSPRRNSLKRMRSPSYEKSDIEIPATPPRKPSMITPQVVSPRKLGQIFKTDSGESFLFFVQVDLYGRHGMVQNIKKNGGKMSGSITDANYVILGNSQSKTYQDLLAQATAANKIPLRNTFIADCVKYEGLLDQNDYVLEDYVPPKKRPRTSTVGAVKEEKPKKEKKEKTKAAPKKTVDPIPHNGPPSPSPPPSKDKVNYVGGHYLFTAEEIEYFKRYTRCLIERDLKVSNTAIMKKLHAKIPHHSVNSWYNYLTRNLPDELDTMRKKIGIAKRKAHDAENNSRAKQVNQTSNNEAGPSKRPSLDSTIADRDNQVMGTAVSNLEEQDFHDICQFFATGGGENSDDDQVWAALETHQHCRSASSWPEFFKNRQDDVVKEIDRLIQENVAPIEQAQGETSQPNGN